MNDPEATEKNILRDHYLEKDFISSSDGILKVLAVIACIVTGALSLAAGGGGRCAAAPGLAGGSAALALAAAAALAALTTFSLLAAPVKAPVLWLYTDVVTSSVIGVLLVVSVILGAVFCELDSPLDYVYFVLGLVSASLTMGSAVLGYAAAMRRVDAARPQREPRRRTPTEQDA